jgi:integrase
VYAIAMRQFYSSINGPEPGDLDAASQRYFSEQRNLKEDVETYFATIKSKAPMTVQRSLSAVRSFFEYNEIELKQKFWKTLRSRKSGTRALTIDGVPEPQELRRILLHMRARGKAFYLILASSGMRFGEALNLTSEDVDFKSNPTKITIRANHTKTGNWRSTFISSEATEALKEWLNVRDDDVRSASARTGKNGRRHAQTDDPRIFPFTRNNMMAIWNIALDKAKLNGKDPQTKYHKFHPHVLRKFFRTQMGSAIEIDVVEALMGHEGYLTQVYRRYNEKTLAEFYLRGEPAVLVFTEAKEITKLTQKVKEQQDSLGEEFKKQKEDLQSIMYGLTAKTLRQEEENAKLRNTLENVQSQMGTLENVQSQMKTLLTENKGYAENLAQLKKNYEDISEALREIMTGKKRT